MVRFKHVGRRAEQIRRDGVKRGREVMTDLAERHYGRSLTADELKSIAEQAEKAFGTGDVYGG